MENNICPLGCFICFPRMRSQRFPTSLLPSTPPPEKKKHRSSRLIECRRLVIPKILILFTRGEESQINETSRKKQWKFLPLGKCVSFSIFPAAKTWWPSFPSKKREREDRFVVWFVRKLRRDTRKSWKEVPSFSGVQGKENVIKMRLEVREEGRRYEY